MGAKAEAWCLRIHADASLSSPQALIPCAFQHDFHVSTRLSRFNMACKFQHGFSSVNTAFKCQHGFQVSTRLSGVNTAFNCQHGFQVSTRLSAVNTAFKCQHRFQVAPPAYHVGAKHGGVAHAVVERGDERGEHGVAVFEGRADIATPRQRVPYNSSLCAFACASNHGDQGESLVPPHTR